MPRMFSGSQLRERRTASGLRPESVALKIGRSYAAINAYENGHATPSVPTLAALADALGCSLDDFFAEVDDNAA